MHIVQVNAGLFRALGGKTPAPMINMEARQKADVMKALQQSFDYGDALIKEFNDQQLIERVMPPRFMGPIGQPRAHHLLLDDPHRGHLRPDGRVPPVERRDAAGERAPLKKGERPTEAPSQRDCGSQRSCLGVSSQSRARDHDRRLNRRVACISLVVDAFEKKS